MRKTVFIVLACLFAGMLQAQISGTVTCQDGKPAQYATVSVYKTENTSSSPVKYAVTNKDGKFSIAATPQQGWWIAVRHVGSKEYRAEIGKDYGRLNILLEVGEGGNLDEVVVKSTYTGISVKGDTIAFDTEHFKTGEEETVSEVLKKLPGMEVSENGDVSFGGKAVDKVLIDGKDMFSSGSDGVINNMSADAMTGAEILKNYKTNSLVDEFRSEELTALNIKTNGKVRISGKATLAAGIQNKAQGNAHVLYMGNKAYFTSVVSANNTGEALMSFSDYLKNIGGLDNLLVKRSRKSSVFSSQDMSLIFPPQNVYKSLNGLWSLSGTYKPSENLKIQGSVLTNTSKTDAQSLSEQLYYIYDIKNRHFTENENKNRFLSFNLREKYKPSSNVEISNMTQFSRTCLNADDSLSEAGLTDMFATQGSEFKKMSFSDEFAVNVKTSKGLLSAHVSFEAVNRNYTYDLLTDNNILPVTYTQIAVNSFNLNTDKEIKNYTFSPDVTYAYQLTDVLNLQTTLAYNYNKNKFSYNDLSSKESEDLTWNEYSATLQLGKNKGFFRFYAGAELRNTHWKTGIEGLDNGSSWHVLPKGSVSLHFSSTHQLSLNANTDNEAIETEYLLRNKMVSGYSSLYLGSDITNPFTKSKNLSVNYNYHNLYSSTMLFCSAGLRENDLVKAHSVQDSSVVMMSKYDNDGHMQSKYLSAHLTQGLGSIPVDLQTGVNLSQSTNETSLNGVHDKMNSLNCSLNLGFISRMKKILNFELSGSYSASKYDYKVSTASNDMAEFGGNAALIFVYKNLTANVRYTFSYLDNETFGRNYSRLGFRAEYRINKFRIHVQGSNVLNVKNMDWVSISANQSYSSSTFYKKIPGYVLAGLSYRW